MQVDARHDSGAMEQRQVDGAPFRCPASCKRLAKSVLNNCSQRFPGVCGNSLEFGEQVVINVKRGSHA